MEYLHFPCTEETREMYRNGFGIIFSEKFCRFFAASYYRLYLSEMGVKPGYKAGIGGFKQQNDTPFYQKGEISKLNMVLWVQPDHYHNFSFCWRSGSGKIIETTDEVFDEADIECWLEGLQPALIWEQTSTEKKSHPFISKNLPFTLKVFGFGINTGLTINLGPAGNAELVAKKVGDTIEKYNDDSERKNRKDGVIHNYSMEVADNKVEFRIDTGSAGVKGINKILTALKKVEGVEEVIIDF